MNVREYLDQLPPLPLWYHKHKVAKGKLEKFLCKYGKHSWKYRYNMSTPKWTPSHQECRVCKLTRGFYK